VNRDVTLVVGPPCAGKTTWALAHAAPGVEVIDFDAIAVDLGSPSSHDHPPAIYWRAVREQRRREQRVALNPRARAIVVRTLADPRERLAVARRLRATYVEVIDPGRDVVEPRVATQRPRRAMEAVTAWYALNPPEEAP